MYSILLTAAFAAAPADASGILFHRHANGCAGVAARSAGCQGTQAVPVQLVAVAQGCSSSFARSAATGCAGGSGGIFARRHARVEARHARAAFVPVQAVSVAPVATVQTVQAPPVVVQAPAPQAFVVAPPPVVVKQRTRTVVRQPVVTFRSNCPTGNCPAR